MNVLNDIVPLSILFIQLSEAVYIVEDSMSVGSGGQSSEVKKERRAGRRRKAPH